MRALSAMAIGMLAACAGDVGAGDEPGSEARCLEDLSSWDVAHPLPPADTTVPLPKEWLMGPAGAAPHAVADGDRSTVGMGQAPMEVVLELPEMADVRGVRHSPSPRGASITRLRVSLGVDGECWGQPVADAGIAVGPFEQDVLFGGRVARYVRLEVLESAADTGDFSAADLGVLVGAAFTTDPELSLSASAPWEYAAQVRILGVGPVTFELIERPGGMEVSSEGLVSWVPHPSQAGEHRVTLVARRQDVRLEQRFAVVVHP